MSFGSQNHEWKRLAYFHDYLRIEISKPVRNGDGDGASGWTFVFKYCLLQVLIVILGGLFLKNWLQEWTLAYFENNIQM